MRKAVEIEEPRSFRQRLGPGLITGAADDDPSGIGTYSSAGAQFGYAMLWLVPFCIPLMIAVQEMCGRVGRITGLGLAGVMRKYYSRYLLYSMLALLVGANLFNIFADLHVMAATAVMLFGEPQAIWLAVFALGIAAGQIWIPYHYYVRVLKWLCVSLLAYVVTALLPSTPNDWRQIAYNAVVPSWNWDASHVMMVVAVLGTTISPYLFFWQASEEVEEEVTEGRADRPGHRLVPVSDDELRIMRVDTSVGMASSQVISFFIMICAVASLNMQGITHVDTARDAAKALEPLGAAGYWLFALGIIGTGLLAIPTLAGSVAYAVSETFGWRYGLYRTFRQAPCFYGVIAGMVFMGYLLNFAGSQLSPVKALYYSAVLNGVVTVPLLFVIMFICNNRSIVKGMVNGRLSNIFGGISCLVMTVTVLVMCVGAWTGKAAP